MPVILQNLIEIINAFVEMFLIFLYFSLLSNRKVGKAGYITAYLLSVGALSASVLLTDELLLSLFITLGILTAVAFYCFEDTIRRRILMIALYMLMISVADPMVIGLLCLANLGSPQDFLESGIGRYLGMIATDLIYLWLIGLMHRLINKRIKDLPVKYWILIITIPIISIFILRNQIDTITASTMAINYFSLGIAVIGIVYINVMMFRFFESYDDKLKLQYFETLKQQEDENYKLLALSHKQVREMISKFAKNIAHFFVIQNITEESKEVIYAYGMELLISDVLNTIIVLLIAFISHTLPAVVVFIAVFMGLRQFVGGYHANSHLSCMFTLVMVMLVFSYVICNVSEQITQIFSIGFIATALPVIFCIAPVPHPNKPMSEEKGVKLRKRGIILAVALSVAVIVLLVFQYQKISLYVSSGILLSAIMALLGRFLNRGDNSKR